MGRIPQPIADLSPERRKLPEWNATTVADPHEQCIHTLFEAQAARTPDAVALVFPATGSGHGSAQHLTYDELNRRANQLAHHLQALGVRPGVQVGICIERSLELVIGLFGILKAGGAYVPLDPAYPQERLAFMLADARVAVLIRDQGSGVGGREGAVPIPDPWPLTPDPSTAVDLSADWPLIARASPANPACSTTAADLLYVIYTSGSTGRPKGAGVYHRGFVNLVHWFVSEFEIDFRDRVLLITSLSFDLTQKNIFAPLMSGGAIYLLGSEHYDIAVILRLISDHAITLLNCTPSAFYPLVEQCNQQIAEKLTSLRYVFLGGEPIAVARMRDWMTAQSCKTIVVNTYGPTECTDISAFYRLNDPEQFLEASVPIGKPIDNTQLYVVDHELQLVPMGAVGELCVAGNGVGCGYLGRPDLTAERFVPNPFGTLNAKRETLNERSVQHSAFSVQRLYRTGDRARYRADGNIEFLGRTDEQVKLRGFRIELGEIETVLASHPAVAACVVAVRADVPGEQRLVAYVVQGAGVRDQGSGSEDKVTRRQGDKDEPNVTLSPGHLVTLSDPRSLIPKLLAFLQARLPAYMLPAAFVFLDALPLTPSGKIDRRALSARAPSRPALGSSLSAPHNQAGGFPRDLGAITTVLGQHPAVCECVVEIMADERGDQRLVAYLVPQPNHAPNIMELRQLLQTQLPECPLPSAFVFLAALPLLEDGQLDRRRLPMPAQDRSTREQTFVAPRTAIEQLLAGLWRELLGLEAVGVHESFFELGGNSIQAALFVNKLQMLLGEVVYVVAVFDAPSIAELAAYLAEQYPAAVARLFGVNNRSDGTSAQNHTAPVPAAPIGEAQIAEFRAAITALPPARAGAIVAPNPPAIFILSPPRSGSTLLRVMLAGHSRLFAPPELELLSFNTLAERKAAFAGRDRFWLEGTVRAIMAIKGCDASAAERLMAACEQQAMSVQQFYRQLQLWLGERLLVDKTPAYALDPAILGRMERDFDQAKYIHLLRHPYAMIRSFEEAKLDQVFFRHRHSFTTRQLAELIWLISQQNIMAFLREMPAARQHAVRFEDLVTHPRPTLEDICAFLGLEFQPAMLEPYQVPQQRMTDGIHALSKMIGDVKFHTHRDIDATVSDRWKQQPIADPLGALTWQVAEALGYPREPPAGVTTICAAPQGVVS